jgi:hypothetical protein
MTSPENNLSAPIVDPLVFGRIRGNVTQMVSGSEDVPVDDGEPFIYSPFVNSNMDPDVVVGKERYLVLPLNREKLLLHVMTYGEGLGSASEQSHAHTLVSFGFFYGDNDLVRKTDINLNYWFFNDGTIRRQGFLGNYGDEEPNPVSVADRQTILDMLGLQAPVVDDEVVYNNEAKKLLAAVEGIRENPKVENEVSFS